jgi:hypothetical protein
MFGDVVETFITVIQKRLPRIERRIRLLGKRDAMADKVTIKLSGETIRGESQFINMRVGDTTTLLVSVETTNCDTLKLETHELIYKFEVVSID